MSKCGWGKDITLEPADPCQAEAITTIRLTDPPQEMRRPYTVCEEHMIRLVELAHSTLR